MNLLFKTSRHFRSKKQCFSFILKQLYMAPQNRSSIRSVFQQLSQNGQKLTPNQLLSIYSHLGVANASLSNAENRSNYSPNLVASQQQLSNTAKTKNDKQKLQYKLFIWLEKNLMKPAELEKLSEKFNVDLLRLHYYRLLAAMRCEQPYQNIIQAFKQQILFADILGVEIVEYIDILAEKPLIKSQKLDQVAYYILDQIERNLKYLELSILPHLIVTLSKASQYYRVSYKFIEQLEKLIYQNRESYNFEELMKVMPFIISSVNQRFVNYFASKVFDLNVKRLFYLYIEQAQNNIERLQYPIKESEKKLNRAGIPGNFQTLNQKFLKKVINIMEQYNLYYQQNLLSRIFDGTYQHTVVTNVDSQNTVQQVKPTIKILYNHNLLRPFVHFHYMYFQPKPVTKVMLSKQLQQQESQLFTLSPFSSSSQSLNCYLEVASVISSTLSPQHQTKSKDLLSSSRTNIIELHILVAQMILQMIKVPPHKVAEYRQKKAQQIDKISKGFSQTISSNQYLKQISLMITEDLQTANSNNPQVNWICGQFYSDQVEQAWQSSIQNIISKSQAMFQNLLKKQDRVKYSSNQKPVSLQSNANKYPQSLLSPKIQFELHIAHLFFCLKELNKLLMVVSKQKWQELYNRLKLLISHLSVKHFGKFSKQYQKVLKLIRIIDNGSQIQKNV